MAFTRFIRSLATVTVLIALPAAATALDAPKASASSDKSADKPAGGARAADPLANLKPYEERRYRIDMEDCGKEKGADRRVCERTVRRHAEAKSRRRATVGY